MLELDYTNVLEQTVRTQGIPKVAFDKAAVSSKHVVEDIEKAHAVGKLGFGNLPARLPADASALYARNVLNFLALSLNAKTGEFAVPKDDEIIKATLVCENGAVVPRS